MFHTLIIPCVQSITLSGKAEASHQHRRHILFNLTLFPLPHADLSPCFSSMLHIDKAYYCDILHWSSFQLISTATSVTVSAQSKLLPQWRWRQPLLFTYCHPMLCQYQKLPHIHTMCDLHQIYIFLNGGLCVICKYPVNFIHINERAFALSWHFYANCSNSLCAVSLYVTQATAPEAGPISLDEQHRTENAFSHHLKERTRGSEEFKHGIRQITWILQCS